MSPKASTRLLATQSDERLAAMARAGHDRAFEALVQRYRRPLLRYCRRISISDGRAEDVVQQTLLQAWSALRRGANVRELRPWLYRIAHNTAVNLARDAARDGANLAVDLDGVTAAESATVEPDLGGGLALRDALTDMAALPHMQREVIFRTALAGHSHEEVATALGITDGAVRGLLYRARSTLRTAITALTPPPMLAWMAGGGQGIAVDRAGELAAGGGGIGLGVLLKGGVAVLTAGTLITGAAIVHSTAPARHHAHPAPKGTGREVASLGSANGFAAHPGATAIGGAAGSSSSVPRTSPRSVHGQALSLRVSAGGPRVSARLPAGSPQNAPVSRPKGIPPTSTTFHIPLPAGAAPPSNSSASNAPSEGSSGAASGAGGSGSTGGGSGGSGSGGGGSGGAGTGSGGSGTGSGGGGAGSGSGGGNPGGGSPGGGSPGGGTGSSGPGSGGAAPESSPPPSGSGSPSSGPVATIVNGVTGLLEHTVHGVLGH
ncbi:MAG TPA: RNA polymerase sigma factor [Solirubrobacteraceae bacterium]|nr:RNA polymerase sigma factor [Solirubrobacteraceae bacterium]